MKITTKISLIWIAFIPAIASAMIVFDPEDIAQNTITATVIKKVLSSVSSENSFVQNNQYTVLGNQLNTLNNQYTLSQTNLTALINLAQLLGNNNVYSSQNGMQSAFSTLDNLNTSDPNYQSQRNTILNGYYPTPEDPSQVAETLGNYLNPSALNTLQTQAQQNTNTYQIALDAYAKASDEQQAQAQRENYLSAYDTAISHLGNASQLQTEQLSATELNMLLKQQENALSSLQAIQQYQVTNVAQQASGQAQEFTWEQDRLAEAASQGTTTFGRNTWGNY